MDGGQFWKRSIYCNAGSNYRFDIYSDINNTEFIIYYNHKPLFRRKFDTLAEAICFVEALVEEADRIMRRELKSIQETIPSNKRN